MTELQDSGRRVRVRFAPSPTGPLHIGGVRTALFNYLFAKQHGGDFLLRIEDTDSSRYVEGAEQYIFESLRWCGLHPDEGVEEGGEYGPYRQSERKAIYLQYAEQLVSSGWAYYAFDSAEELEDLRRKAEGEGRAFSYGPATRGMMRNSLTLRAEEVSQLLRDREDWVIRFCIPTNRVVQMHDLIRGDVEIRTDLLDDKVLYKRADGLPTYHLANIVDDHLMEISHVIRGEEWLPSLPLHYLLYEAFGWSTTQPEFAHLPLILKPTGNGKLSKRDGDKMGFPVFPLQWDAPNGEVFRGYREDGYLPEAFLNMLALLGWNPGSEVEVMGIADLIGQFSLERVSKSGARFDPDKAKWFNHAYVQRAPLERLVSYLSGVLLAHGVEVDAVRVAEAVGLVRDRVSLLPDLWAETDYLWVSPSQYDEKALSKHADGDTAARLGVAAARVGEIERSVASVESMISQLVEELHWGKGKLMNTFRIALVGASRGVDVASIICFIGGEEAARRFRVLAAHLG